MGVVDGNPVHEETLAIVKTLPPDLILDVTLDEANQITGVFAGELEAAWRAGVAFAAQHVRATVAEPADIVVTSCAGIRWTPRSIRRSRAWWARCRW